MCNTKGKRCSSLTTKWSTVRLYVIVSYSRTFLVASLTTMFISGCSTLDLFHLTYFLFLYNLVWWFCTKHGLYMCSFWYPIRWCSTEPCKMCSEAEIWKLMVEGTQRDSLMGREDRGDWNHQTSIELALGSYRVVFIFLDLIFFKKRELRMYFETSLMSLDPCSCTLTESFVQATLSLPESAS